MHDEREATPIFDLELATTYCGSKRDLALRLARKLADVGPGEIEAIAHAIETGNAKEAATAAHRLKGSAAPLGAERLRRAAEEIEAACREGQPADALADRLRDEIREFVGELNRHPEAGPR
ncbi:MAG: Hpt domain-containing protein [Gemmatimonadetes bacterium]|nr:Hpt domain-containing protein [Gemmatimonadota bacterium]